MSLLSQYKKRQKSMQKIDVEQLNQLKIRRSIIESKRMEVDLLTNEYNTYVTTLLQFHGCDPKKNYVISFESGEIKEEAPTPPITPTAEELEKAGEVITNVLEEKNKKEETV